MALNRIGVVARFWGRLLGYAGAARSRVCALRREQEGQGTTEYAILVGVLVVIAIVAIAAFRGRVQDLWTSITNALNGL